MNNTTAIMLATAKYKAQLRIVDDNPAMAALPVKTTQQATRKPVYRAGPSRIIRRALTTSPPAKATSNAATVGPATNAMSPSPAVESAPTAAPSNVSATTDSSTTS